MAITEGDFVKINFTGKIKSTDTIYSTTIEELAHEAGIYNQNNIYTPSIFVMGAHQTFRDVEDALIGCEVGDRKTVEIPAERAFGQRDPKLIKTMHIKEFKKMGLNPYSGLVFQSEGKTGRVLTVNGGRVKVDYNNEMAGKDIVCDVEVCEIVEDKEEKIKGLIQLRFAVPSVDINKTKLEFDDNVLNITLDPFSKFVQYSYQEITLIRFDIARDIYKNIEGITQVNFIDEFINTEEQVPEEENVSEGENAFEENSISEEENISEEQVPEEENISEE